MPAAELIVMLATALLALAAAVAAAIASIRTNGEPDQCFTDHPDQITDTKGTP